MYIEASRPRKQNDVAFLQTYLMPATEYCLDVNYNMFGVSVISHRQIRAQNVTLLTNCPLYVL